MCKERNPKKEWIENSKNNKTLDKNEKCLCCPGA